jgi:hypothetical protein
MYSCCCTGLYVRHREVLQCLNYILLHLSCIVANPAILAAAQLKINVAIIYNIYIKTI